MKRLRNPVIILAVLVMGISATWAASSYVMQPNESLVITGRDCTVGASKPSTGGVTVDCGPLHTPSAQTADLIEGVAVCADHNPTAWHPLVKKTGTTITCTYGHEHHADPNSVNDLFGVPSAWYGGTQAISYPWQTSSTLGHENHVKHEGYKWFVQRDQPCRPAGTGTSGGCFLAWRIQVHSRGDASDAVVRFHSYSMEALVEHAGVRGIIRHGGWLDFGHLALVVNGGSGNACPVLASNPETFRCGSSPERNHSTWNPPAPLGPTTVGLAAWYSNHGTTSLSVVVGEWGPIDYTSPATQQFWPQATHADVGHRNAYGSLGNIWAQADHPYQAPNTTNGVVNLNAYTPSSGSPLASGCAAPSPTCVPIVFESVPRGQFFMNSGTQGASLQHVNYDVMSPSTGKSLIRFPN